MGDVPPRRGGDILVWECEAVTVLDDAPEMEGEDGRWECAVWKEVVLGVDVDASLSVVCFADN